MKKNPGEFSSASRTRIAATVVATFWVAALGSVEAQSLRWGTFNTLMPFGSGSTATVQTHVATVAGSDRGSGPISITLGVAGGTASWNGFGIGANDDGYFSAPNQPQPGITMVTGAPGYNGGIPAASQVSFATGYNVVGGPSGLPLPPSDRAAIYFDAGSGTTVTAALNFSALNGGSLPAGSWLFIDNVDQGERVIVTGPTSWVATAHFGDSTLPRPAFPTTIVSVPAPTFPACAPAVSMTATTLQLDGRYGDVSTATPTCANAPVPVFGQTVGYTKGMDSVGVWIRTAIDLTSLSLTAADMDANPANGPDNNFSLGLAVIAATVPIPAPPVPTMGVTALGILLALLLSGGALVLRRNTTRPRG